MDQRSRLNATASRMTTEALNLWWNLNEQESLDFIPHYSKSSMVFAALARMNPIYETGKGNGRRFLAQLRLLLQSRDAKQRDGALKVLIMVGEPAIDLLVTQTIFGIHPRVRLLKALEQMTLKKRHPTVVSILMEALRDSRAEVRYWTLQALAALRKASGYKEQIWQTVINLALQDSHGLVRTYAQILCDCARPIRYTQGSASPNYNPVSTPHSPLLEQEPQKNITATPASDAELKPEDSSTVPELISSQEFQMRVASLRAGLNDPDEGKRVSSVRKLGEMGSAAASPKIVSRLYAALNDRGREVRCEALEALGQILWASGDVAALSNIMNEAITKRDSRIVQTGHKWVQEIKQKRQDELMAMLETVREANIQQQNFKYYCNLVREQDSVTVHIHAAQTLCLMRKAHCEPDVLRTFWLILDGLDEPTRGETLEVLNTHILLSLAFPGVLDALCNALTRPGSALPVLEQLSEHEPIFTQPTIIARLLQLALSSSEETVRSKSIQILKQVRRPHSAAFLREEVLKAPGVSASYPRTIALRRILTPGSLAIDEKIVMGLLHNLTVYDFPIRTEAFRIFEREIRLFATPYGPGKIRFQTVEGLCGGDRLCLAVETPGDLGRTVPAAQVILPNAAEAELPPVERCVAPSKSRVVKEIILDRNDTSIDEYHIITVAEQGFSMLNIYLERIGIDIDLIRYFSNRINEDDCFETFHPIVSLSAIPRRHFRSPESSPDGLGTSRTATLLTHLNDFVSANAEYIQSPKIAFDFRVGGGLVPWQVVDACHLALQHPDAQWLEEVLIVLK